MFTFGLISLGKVWTPYLYPESYGSNSIVVVCCFFFTQMALALNNPRRLTCHWTKKPNQTKVIYKQSDLEYVDCISCREARLFPPKNCIRWWGSSSAALGMCGSPLHCNYTQFHSVPGVVVPVRVLSIYLSIGWLVGWFYDISTIFESFNAELSHFDKSLKQSSWV